MHILIDARHLMRGRHSGVGEYTIELLRAVFSLDKKTTFTLLTTGNARAPVLPNRLMDAFSDPHEPTTAQRRVVRQLSPTVRHVHVRIPNKLLNARIVTTGRPTLSALSGTRPDVCFLPNLNIVAHDTPVPTCITIHDLSWHLFPEFYSYKMRLWHKLVRPETCIKHACTVITPSTRTADDVADIFDKPKVDIHTIPHGVLEAFHPRRQPTDHGIRSQHRLPNRFALYLGTIEPRKNVSTIIEAVRDYRNRTQDDLRLVIAGGVGWKARDVRMQLHPDMKPSWIHHLGYVPSDHRPALYREADVCIWPSFYEGFGLPVLEAMASGTPVITSNTSSLPELTGNAALLVNPHNISDVRQALEQLLASNSLQKRLSKRGRERAAQFHWETAANMTLKTLKNTIK